MSQQPPQHVVPSTLPTSTSLSLSLAPGEVLPPKGLVDSVSDAKLAAESSSSSTVDNAETIAKPLDPLEAFARELMEEGRRVRQQKEKHSRRTPPRRRSYSSSSRSRSRSPSRSPKRNTRPRGGRGRSSSYSSDESPPPQPSR